MTITPVNGVGVTSPATTAPSTSGENPSATLDRDAFLKLLVAQLKYQDPTNPADTSQMVAQTAQLTMVDRLNDIAQQLKSSSVAQQLGLASSLVGKQITFAGPDGYPQAATVESVLMGGDQPTLLAAGLSIPLAAVTSIEAPPVGVLGVAS
jgi:flagellar basal-body rod modification protein FlgD